MFLYLIYVICPSSTSEMTYIVSGGALNSTHSLTEAAYPGPYLTAHRVSLEDVIS